MTWDFVWLGKMKNEKKFSRHHKQIEKAQKKERKKLFLGNNTEQISDIE